MHSRLSVSVLLTVLLTLVASHAVRAADPVLSERDEISSTTKGVEENEHAIDMHRYQSPSEGCLNLFCLFSGDVDGNGIPGEIEDLAFLVAYISGGGPSPSPLYEGDANGDCRIDQRDVDYYTCILFGGGGCTGDESFPQPAPCECYPECCYNRMGSVHLDSEASGFCNSDSTSDQTVDVADLTNMIDHLFVNFTPICCPDENDFAPLMYGEPQDGAIDVADLSGLIDHLFINFTELPCCP